MSLKDDGKVSHKDISINTSLKDDGKVSHIDVNDASKGFSIWSDAKLGKEDLNDWYFIMPSLIVDGNNETDHGAGNKFHGIAVKLYHGVGISWDGRAIRHNSTVNLSSNNGKKRHEKQHVYGTFVAAKTAILEYGLIGSKMALEKELEKRKQSPILNHIATEDKKQKANK